MLEEKIKINLEFSDKLGQFYDQNFTNLYEDALIKPDIDFSDDDTIELERDGDMINVLVCDDKVKNKIAALLLENRVQDEIFIREYDRSKNTQVIGYD